jgi:hypothetical protein
MIRGIGPVYAKRMIKAFGAKVFDITEADTDRLREVDGIGSIRANGSPSSPAAGISLSSCINISFPSNVNISQSVGFKTKLS